MLFFKAYRFKNKIVLTKVCNKHNKVSLSSGLGRNCDLCKIACIAVWPMHRPFNQEVQPTVRNKPEG